MSRLLFFLALALFACTVSSCAGGSGTDPYQELGNRVSQRALINNHSVTTAVGDMRCPSGMKPSSDTASIQSQTTITYQESHGGYGNGSSSVYGTDSGANIRVQADAGASGRRQVLCEIDRTPATQ